MSARGGHVWCGGEFPGWCACGKWFDDREAFEAHLPPEIHCEQAMNGDTE